ncbi:hypothetical protein A3K80_04755 [Candidatus Bathyarchaeota archaeon RBG_13_38_9]|nr:MAG: hypothetical protein A3K80_04755 [Candidatus Bathyarchaeota archaeon RBG_13_38_9]
MRAGPTFGGLAILIVGLLLANFASFTYTVEVAKDETKIIFNNERIPSIGDSVAREIYLEQGWVFNVEGKISIPDSNESGQIDFFIMNSSEYQKWKTGEKDIEYVIRREKVSRFNETFIPQKNETYYLLFDNSEDTTYKKAVIFSGRYIFETKAEEIREEDILKQAGYPLAIIGAAFLIYGLIRKPEVRWE